MDKVGDLLIRIKNGYMASNKEVLASYSKLSLAICQVLKEEGYILGFTATEREIKIVLKYVGKRPSLVNVKRISKPGLRVYRGSKLLPKNVEGLGIAIISTPKGIMTHRLARKEGLGGEVMALVW